MKTDLINKKKWWPGLWVVVRTKVKRQNWHFSKAETLSSFKLNVHNHICERVCNETILSSSSRTQNNYMIQELIKNYNPVESMGFAML